jgi:hypothetical protein
MTEQSCRGPQSCLSLESRPTWHGDRGTENKTKKAQRRHNHNAQEFRQPQTCSEGEGDVLSIVNMCWTRDQPQAVDEGQFIGMGQFISSPTVNLYFK